MNNFRSLCKIAPFLKRYTVNPSKNPRVLFSLQSEVRVYGQALLKVDCAGEKWENGPVISCEGVIHLQFFQIGMKFMEAYFYPSSNRLGIYVLTSLIYLDCDVNARFVSKKPFST